MATIQEHLPALPDEDTLKGINSTTCNHECALRLPSGLTMLIAWKLNKINLRAFTFPFYCCMQWWKPINSPACYYGAMRKNRKSSEFHRWESLWKWRSYGSVQSAKVTSKIELAHIGMIPMDKSWNREWPIIDISLASWDGTMPLPRRLDAVVCSSVIPLVGSKPSSWSTTIGHMKNSQPVTSDWLAWPCEM